jgi:hypothetical protein
MGRAALRVTPSVEDLSPTTIEVRTSWKTPTGRCPELERTCCEHVESSGNLQVDDSDLLRLMLQSLARGHHKVALRRALMHLSTGGKLPPHLCQSLEQTAARCRPTELGQMLNAASAWARMARSAAPQVLSDAPMLLNLAVRQGARWCSGECLLRGKQNCRAASETDQTSLVVVNPSAARLSVAAA